MNKADSENQVHPTNTPDGYRRIVNVIREYLNHVPDAPTWTIWHEVAVQTERTTEDKILNEARHGENQETTIS